MPQIDNRRPSTDGQLNLPLVAAGLTISTPDAIDKLTSAKLKDSKPCLDCGCTGKQIGPGAGPHAGRLTCLDCGSFIQWVKKSKLPALKAIEGAFGGDFHE